MILPEKSNGDVTGAYDIFFTIGYRDFFNIYSSFSKYVDGEFISDFSYSAILSSEGNDKFYISNDGESKEVSFSEIQYNMKKKYGIIVEHNKDGITTDGYTRDEIDNSLISKTGSFNDYIFYDSDTRLLTKADLEAMIIRYNCTSPEDKKKYLEFALQEMPAIHGYKFKQVQTLKDHFESHDWYNKTDDKNKYYINEIEKANEALIDSYEAELGLNEIKLS